MVESPAIRTDYIGPKDNALTVIGPCTLTDAIDPDTTAYIDSRTMGPYVTDTPIKYDISDTIMYGSNHPPETNVFVWGEQALGFNFTDSGQQIAIHFLVQPWMDLTKPMAIYGVWFLNTNPAPYAANNFRAGAWVYSVHDGLASNFASTPTSGLKTFSGSVFAHQNDRVSLLMDGFTLATDMPLVTPGDYVTSFISRRGGDPGDNMDVTTYLVKVYLMVYQKHTT